MSMKRTSDADDSSNEEPSIEEKTTENSDEIFVQTDVKRGKFTSVSNMMVNALPTEMLEYILVEAIAMEVRDMKLAKSAWKEKADLIISKLKTVCSLWSCILSTKSFENQLHKALDAVKTIRLELLHESVFNYFIIDVTTLKNELLVFCLELDPTNNFHNKIKFYDRNILDEVKEVISLPEKFPIKNYDSSMIGQVEKVTTLPGIRPAIVVACNVSDCVYILEQNRDNFESSVFRITRDKDRQLIVQTWITELDFGVDSMSVSPAGKLIIIESAKVSIYSSNGFLQQQLQLSSEIVVGFRHADRILEKSNGSLLLAYSNAQYRPLLTQINKQWTVKRPNESSLQGAVGVNFADASGRVVMYDPVNGMKLVDAELNPLEFTGSLLKHDNFKLLSDMQYDSQRNEVLVVRSSHDDPHTCLLTIFHFRDD